MDDPVAFEFDEGRRLRITPELAIPRSELQFRTSRSGGPGGQHVNKVETRVELLFDVAGSPSLPAPVRALLLQHLASRLDADGVFHLTSEQSRSQYRNREEAVARFVLLLQQALRPRKTRKATRIPRGVQEARLQEKRVRSATKRLRGRGREFE